VEPYGPALPTEMRLCLPNVEARPAVPVLPSAWAILEPRGETIGLVLVGISLENPVVSSPVDQMAMVEVGA
jgi:hypothetical protein